jgi:signal transduction histidine kinase
VPSKPKPSRKPPVDERRASASRGRRSADREGVQRIVELARAAGELEEFSTIAAHDLHAPLRTISGFAQLLEERHAANLDDEGREFLRQILDGAGRLQELLDDLLDYSRLARCPPTLAETDLGAALRLAMQGVAPALRACGGVLTSDALPRLAVDEPRTVQLFRELLDNAVKFRGERPLRVHVSVAVDRREVVVSVADNGIGIDPQQFERIFRIFARLHPVGRYPGTGFGLAASKRIVEHHGGRIWVESEPGRGATFRFALPVAR